MRADRAVHTVHPALLRAFGALDGAGVAWCLLRGEAQLADPPGDVDLLVGPADLPRLDAVLAAAGFVPVPAWGKGAHRGFVGRDTASDRFFELDVESSVEFGPSAHFAVNWLAPKLRTDAAAALLAGRRRVGPLAVPGVDDGFWALLLHCIVDKRAVADRHAARLAELLPQARPDGVLGRIVTAHCPAGWDAARVLTTARAADWPALVALGARLPGRARVSQRAAALGRGLRRLAADVGRTRRGLSVAVLGPDGAGKSTLTQGIAASFGLPARVVYMGLWQGEDGAARPLPLAALSAARRPFRSWRRAALTRWHQARGRLVVLDRHPYDALLPPAPPHVALKRLFFWVLARTAPAPSVVLILDVPAEVAAFRRPDEDPAALATLRSEYLALSRRLPGAVVLDADRPPEALRAAAVDRIWQAVLDSIPGGEPRDRRRERAAGRARGMAARRG
jgi:thymidylate kinase